MSERRPIIGGNWKMHTDRRVAGELAGRVAAGPRPEGVDLVLCPPHPYLMLVAEAIEGAGGTLELGGQDCSDHDEGAHTGQVSPLMLRDAGARWTIVGHSERRHGLGESDELVGRKLARGIAGGLRVILCVGELDEERQAGRTEEVVGRQLDAALDALAEAGGRPGQPGAEDLVIAYEPVWAIGTGRTAGAEDAQSVHAFIRSRLTDRYDAGFASGIRLQYGGSVKPGNAADLFAAPDVDGFLVGGASLSAPDFLAIADAVAGS